MKILRRGYHSFFLQWLLTFIFFFALANTILLIKKFPTAELGVNITPLVFWTAMPGQRISSEDPRVREDVGIDGMRVSRPDINCSRPYRVLVMGCSYTYGMGVSSPDTYVYKLNEKFKDILFDNGGVYGYGPYRSRIRLTQLIQHKKYDLVIYSMLGNHCERSSIAKTRLSGSHLYALPFTEMTSDFRFIDHPLRDMIIPGDNLFPILHFIGQYYITYDTRRYPIPTKNQQLIILSQQLNRMEMVAASYGCKFLLVSLDNPNLALNKIKNCLNKSIYVFDNNLYRQMLPSDYVNNNIRNHPGATVHNYWAENLAKYLSKEEIRKKLIEHRKYSQYPEHRTMYDIYHSQGCL